MALTTSEGSGRTEPRSEPAVLVIEPNEEHQILSTMALGRRGFRVTVAGTAREGLRIALSQSFVAIVLDFKVRDLPALEILSVLVERLPDVPKIFVVASGSESVAVRALAAGAAGALVKTARYNELLPSEVEAQIRAAGARKSLKEQKKALGESEERFQKAFRASPVAISLATSDTGRFVDVNEAFLRLFGYSKSEVLGRTARDLGLYVDDAEFDGVRNGLLEHGSVRDTELRFRTKAGETRIVSVSLESTDIEGTPCYLTLFRDVTEERQGERLRAALYSIVEATESTKDLQELFRQIHEIVAGLMPAKNFYIALHDPATDEVSFPYFVDEKEPTPAPYKPGRGLTEYVLRTGDPLLVTPSRLRQLIADGSVEKVGVEGVDWLGVPLSVGGRVVGVLAVQSYAEATRYTDREKDVLAFVSSQVAMAIERKRAQDALRQAEARFRTMFQGAPTGILLVGPDARILESNPACQAMLGSTAEELRGKHLREITAAEDIDDSLRLFDSLIRGERPSYVLEKRYIRKDGSLLWGKLTATLLHTGTGVAAVGMIQDVTEERKALEDREAADRKFQAMIERISDGISLVGPEGKVFWQSPSAYRLSGYPPEEVLGRNGFEFVHPDDAAQLGPVLADLLATPGKNVTAEFRIRHKSGSWRWMEAIGTNLLADPNLRAVVLNYRDITERNEALEQIRFQASLLGQVRNAVIATDKDLRIVFWNEAAISMFGWRFSEVLGKNVQDMLPAPGSREGSAEVLRRVQADGLWEGEREMIRKDASTFPAEVSLTLLRDRHDTVIGLVGVCTDVTERAMSRRELEIRARQQAVIAGLGRKALVEPLLSTLLNEAVSLVAQTLEVEYAAVLELLPDQTAFSEKAKVGSHPPAGAPIVNDPHTDMAGYAVSVGGSVVVNDAELENRFEVPEAVVNAGLLSGIAVVIPGAAGPYGVLAVHSKGKRAYTEDDIHFCESIANVIADALQRNRIEKSLAENERMASMGQLAAYVAHEVNTPLTNISLLASSIARRTKDPEILQKLEAIGEQRRKATAIIMDILEFPRQRSSRRVPEDIRKVVAAAAEQVAPYRKPEVSLRVDTGDRAVFANIDVIQIRDVFVNLLKNALDATSAGSVSVTLKEWPEFLFISVTDTGTGLAPDVLNQLFHPVSTLRTPSEGAALGLAVCRSIVAAHGGKIEATSEVGKGSTFTVILPRFEAY